MLLESFRRNGSPPPPHYRTPSPPHWDVEPISPLLSDSANVWNGYQNIPRAMTSGERDGRTWDPRGADGYTVGDTPPSTMEAFATIALAAKSSQLSARQPGTYRRPFESTQTSELGYCERPLKRARNEKYPPPDLRHNASSFGGYKQENEDCKHDAELLLNFSRIAHLTLAGRLKLRQEHGRTKACSTASTSQLSVPLGHYQAPDQSPSWDSRALPKQDNQGKAEQQEKQERYDGTPRHIEKLPSAPVLRTVQYSKDMTNTTLSDTTTGTAITHPYTPRVSKIDNGTTDLSSAGKLESPFGQPETQPELPNRWAPKGNDDSPFHSTLDASLASPSHTPHNSGLVAKFLDGIEEAAREPLPIITQELGPAIAENMQAIKEVSGVPSTLSIPKKPSADSPSVCAACNFSRNILTLETENNATSWISCDGCKGWFHFACAGFRTEREVRGVDKYRCRKCKPIHGATTYVRKSARAHSAIDYAGLNEGVLKTSDENPEHHYIKPIKEGIIKFNPETFARMRPELVTAAYFEKGDGMKEPIVIPADWNPRPRAVPGEDPQHSTIDEDDSKGRGLLSNDLHDRSVLDQWLSHDFEYEVVPDEGQDALDMVIPQDLTVRKVAELYGPEEKVEVINVKSQNGEDKKWNMRRWADYYESQGNKIVRNVISLEVSHSKLGRLIRRPKVVRQLDLQDSVWPADLLAKGDYPKVQFYCLMSVADCFTDFHIDFGGSSVFYHILKGKKTFFFIPPHERHLKKYEEWCMSPAQNWTFLGDQTKECYRVDLSEGDTMLIPAGWIHAVWTPEDSLVIGGNFLTRMHYKMQIRVAQIEKATGVARKFRYPHFQKLLWYTALRYLEGDPVPDSVVQSLQAGQSFHRDQPTYVDSESCAESSVCSPGKYHARYYSKHELEGLPELGRYLQRTAYIAMNIITDGISADTRNAVKRSIPKGHGHGEPFDVVKKFALWYTWKIGNEPIPHWAYPDFVPAGGANETTEKKLSVAALRRLDRDAALQAWQLAPERKSTRGRSHPQIVTESSTIAVNGQTASPDVESIGASTPLLQVDGTSKRKLEDPVSGTLSPGTTSSSLKKIKPHPKTHTSMQRRPACDDCRKRRRACKHKEALLSLPSTPPPPEQMEQLVIVNSNPQVRVPLSGGRDLLDNSGVPSYNTALSPLAQTPPGSDRIDLQVTTQLEPAVATTTQAPTMNVASTDQPKVAIVVNQDANSGRSVESPSAGILTFPSSSPLKTPGRSKACNDCRKSKVSLISSTSTSRLLIYHSAALCT